MALAQLRVAPPAPGAASSSSNRGSVGRNAQLQQAPHASLGRRRSRRLQVVACHRCLLSAQRQLVPQQLQLSSCRGPGSAAALKRGSAEAGGAVEERGEAGFPAPSFAAAPAPNQQQQLRQQQQQATPPGDQQQQGERQEEEQDSAGVRAALAMLRFYKAAISPLLPPACRFQPTCSVYSMEAFKKFGVGKGFVLTAWRLLRCAPWGDKGYDPPRWPPPHLGALFRE